MNRHQTKKHTSIVSARKGVSHIALIFPEIICDTKGNGRNRYRRSEVSSDVGCLHFHILKGKFMELTSEQLRSILA